MKHLLKSGLFVFAAVLTLFALSVAVSAEPAQATVTLTETQINSSFRVTNPVYRRVTNLHVDLHPGQAVVSATSAGGTVTMFVYVTQAWPADLNRVWFDDASLSVGGAGGSGPAQETRAGFRECRAGGVADGLVHGGLPDPV